MSNDGLQKKELITKLETLSFLHQKALSIKREMDNFIPDDTYERKVKVPVFPGEYGSEEERVELENSIDHCDEDAVEQMAKEYDDYYAPQKPKKPRIKDFEYQIDTETKNKQDKLGCFSYIAAGVSAFCLLSIILGTAEGAVFAIIVIALIAALLFFFFRSKVQAEKNFVDKKREEALAEYTSQKEELLAQYAEAEKQYESECGVYQVRKQEFLDAYIPWRNVYLEHAKEEMEIAEKLEEDRVAEVEKIRQEEFLPVLQEMAEENDDLITVEYLPVLDTLIDLLKSGRADGLKEAINLYEDIVYKERQLQLQKEQEEQRLLAAERHHQDALAMREKELKQQVEIAEKAEKAKALRHKEMMDQQEKIARDAQLAQKQQADEDRRRKAKEELDRKSAEDSATRRQCNTCALVGRCSVAFTRPNCASYRPR